MHRLINICKQSDFSYAPTSPEDSEGVLLHNESVQLDQALP